VERISVYRVKTPAREDKEMKRLILLFGLILPLVARATFINGNTLSELCSDTQDNPYKVGNCAGYVMAIADVMDRDYYRRFDERCLPAGVGSKQLEKVVVKWLDDNPATLHLSAQYLITNALIEGFGCDVSEAYNLDPTG
jgi:hypothetical protein